MRNSLLVSIALGLLTVAQANPLDFAELRDRKIGVVVVPRTENEISKAQAKTDRLQSDAEISAAFAGIGTSDTGKPCGQQITVVVTETASSGVVKAIETDASGDSRSHPNSAEPTLAPKNNNSANQTTEDRGKKKKNNNENEPNGSGGGNENKQNNNGNGRNRTVEVVTITQNVNNNGGQNDRTVTLSQTQIRNEVNRNEAVVTQLSFVTQTVYQSGNAPTVTVTPLAQVITQLVTVTANPKTAVEKVITVTEHAQAVAAAPAATVTVTEPGICATTTGLPGATSPKSITQNTPTTSIIASKVETAPSPVLSGNANGLGTIRADGLCDCQCLCNTGAFPNFAGTQFVASPAVPATVSPQTTLKTVVSFSAQASAGTVVAAAPVDTVTPAAAAPAVDRSTVSVGAGFAFTDAPPAAVNATASTNIVSATGTASVVKTSSILSSSLSVETSILLAPETTPVAAGTTSVEGTPSSSSAASQVSPGLFLESTTATSATPTPMPEALIQKSSTVSLAAVVTTAPVNSPVAGGLPAGFDINTYSLASTVVLGNLGRR